MVIVPMLIVDITFWTPAAVDVCILSYSLFAELVMCFLL